MLGSPILFLFLGRIFDDRITYILYHKRSEKYNMQVILTQHR